MNKLTKNTGPNNQTESVIYFEQGNQLKAEKKYAEAVIAYRQAIECAGTLSSATYHYQLGEVLGKIDQWPEAVASYRIACQLNPKSFWYNSNLADALVKLGLFDEAVIYYRQSIEIKPDLASFHYNLGKALEQLGQFDQAIICYQKVLEIDSNFTIVYLRLGESYYRKAIELTNTSLSEATTDEIFCQSLATVDNESFVEEVYNFYLKRVADESGKKCYIHQLETGMNTRLEIVSIFRQSQEFINISNRYNHNPVFYKIKLTYLEQAQANYELAKQKNQKNFTEHHKLVAINKELTKVLVAIGKPEKALALLSKYDLQPDDWEICYNLAQAHIKMSWNYYLKGQLFASLDSLAKAIDFYQIQRAYHPLIKTKLRFWAPYQLNGGWPWLSAIGHIVQNIEFYVKTGKLGWHPEYETILLAPTENVINPCMLNYWGNHICVVSDPELIDQLLPIAQRLSCLEYNLHYVQLPSDQMVDLGYGMSIVQRQWEAEKRPPLLSLSATDRENGWRCLQEAGIPKDAWFVSLHARESGYRGDISGSRNVDIETYLQAIESIVTRGGWVIRLGDPTMKPLPKLKNTFDYIHSPFRSDWMDVFLSSQCHFFLGSASGLIAMPWVFGTPTLMTNTWPLAGVPPTSNSLFIPKLAWLEGEKRHLSFGEMLSSDCFYNINTPNYQGMAIKAVDNTSEEINDAVREMIEKLEGKASHTQEDEILQQRFRSLPTPYGPSFFGAPMGLAFLRKYANLLRE